MGRFHSAIRLCSRNLFSLPNHSIIVCAKGKIINRGVGYWLEIPAEYILYGNEKAIPWTKRTLDGVNENAKKKF